MKTKSARRDGKCHWCQQEVKAGDDLFPVLESTFQISRAKKAQQKSLLATSSADGTFSCTTANNKTTPILTCQPASATDDVNAAADTTITTTTSSSCRTSFWIHAACAQEVFHSLGKPVEPPVCRHWLRSLGNKCPFDEACFFHHPVLSSSNNGGVSSFFENVPPPPKRTWGGRRKKLFKPTSSIFRAWLLNTFGHDYLLQSSTNDDQHVGVLDVAGGKGELAFELENLSGIRTFVVDPRPLTLRNAFMKWNSGHFDKAAANPLLEKYLTHYNRDVDPSYPGHLRVFFNSDLMERLFTTLQYQNGWNNSGETTKESTLAAAEWWEQCRANARQHAWTAKGLEPTSRPLGGESSSQSDEKPNCEEDPANDNHRLQSWLSGAPGDVSDVSQALTILSNSVAILGLHPDQATEACVDFALATNKPFAVVPCCVFSSMFRSRRLKNGAPVKTTKELIQYLMEKDERIQVDTLGFEGMNKVVYLSPERCQR